MSVTLVLVTHPGIASAMVVQASALLSCELDEVITAELDSGIHDAGARLDAILAGSDHGEGVLILTDLPGATPCNRARNAAPSHSAVISGLNLPMLIRAWNYRDRPLQELRDLVVDGGRTAIMDAGP